MEKIMKGCATFAISLLAAMCLQTFATSNGWSQAFCSPKANTARILTRAAPNALHPDWRGDNFVGTGWTLTPKRTVTNVTGAYAVGDLHSGHTGAIVNRNVFILLSEWDCSGSASQDPISATGVAPTAAPRVRPSFNCDAGNLNDAERTVCGNADLSRADANMSSTYNQIFADRQGSAALRNEQNAFLKQRDACGVDVACLKKVYWKRFNDLAWLNGQGHEDK
jgi:uncharacterized protein YecT (DUF1311 family)